MMDGFPFRDGQYYCEDVPLTQLAEEFGTPLWVYSKNYLIGRFREIQEAFAAVEPVVCYSVKANGNLSILKVMQEAGSSFDVVSGGELYRVKEAGADLGRVIFAGVGKTDEELRFALESKILMFNAESEAELDAILAWPRRWGCKLRLLCGSIPISTPRRTPRRRPASAATSSGWTSKKPACWPIESWTINICGCPGSTCTWVRRS